MKAEVDAHCACSSGEKVPDETPPSDNHKTYSREAFVDVLIEWIMVNDQVCMIILLITPSLLTLCPYSINVIENKQLRDIFLMLCKELKDEDIPHCTALCNRILEVWDKHLLNLGTQMGVSH